ncbi:MAG: cytochrome P450 [Actinomycetia bacterium]|nr:cytochrome P450 [Actinomycetes bacterium]
MSPEPAPKVAPVEDWTTDYDPFDPEFVADPYPVLEDLREHCPVAHSDRYNGMAVFTTFDDVATVAHHHDDFSSRRNVINNVPTDKPGLVLPPINYDPPVHTDHRRLLLPFFNPNRVAAWEEPIRQICRRLLDGLEGRAECDIASEYAQEIPGEVTARMLGVPVAEGPRFRDWIHALVEVGPNDYNVAKAATEDVMAYMQDLLEARRADPGDTDVVSYLLEQELDNEPLPDGEIIRALFLIMIAGIDTTWSAIGFCLHHLAAHPDDRRRLAAEPELMPTAIEEFLRVYSPVWVARVAEHDTEVNGCPVAQGDWAVIDFRSANRDAAAFDQADEFVIDRAQNRHTAFGLGVHRCLGSNLARLEMEIAVEMWMERFPEFTLTDPGAVTYSAGPVRGPRHIPIRFD